MLNTFDTYLFNAVNHGLANELFDHIMPFITDRSYIILLPFLVWLFVKDHKKALLAVVLSISSLVIADWIIHVLKDVIGRPRPFMVLEDARVLVGKGKSFSMPSGHAASAFAVVTPLILLFSGITRPILILGALTVAFSRLYVGVHYPFDVLVGAAVGLLSSVVVIALYRWSSMKYREDAFLPILLMILAVISVFRLYYIVTGPLELGPDEAYYWELSRRLDIGYLTEGPFVAFVIAAGRALFSDTVFGVRIGAVFCSASSSLMMFMLVRKLFDDRTALYSAVLFQFIPLISLLGILMTAESIFMVFWIISLYIVWKIALRIEEGEKTKWCWLLLGLSVGTGMLSHFSLVLIFVLTFIFMVSDRGLRVIMARPYPYMSLIVSLMVYSPVIIWNAGHDWPALTSVVHHSLVSKGVTRSLSNVARTIGLQLVMITPVLFMLVWISAFRIRGDRRGTFLFFFSVPLLIVVVVASVFWETGLSLVIAPYITGMIAFSYLYLTGYSLLRNAHRSLVVLGLLMAVLTSIVSLYPRELRLPLNRDPSIAFTGWRQLGEHISKLASGMEEKGKYFIIADNCRVASELAFYVRGNPVTYCDASVEALSQYDLWPGFDDMVNYNAIVVVTDDGELPDSLNDFSTCNSRMYDIKRGRETVREITVYECYDYKGIKVAGSEEAQDEARS